MKVALYSTHILWPSHFETDLEVIDNHLIKKDEVDIYVCNRSLHHCELIFDHANYTHVDYNTIKNSFCNKCIQKKKYRCKTLQKQEV